MLETAWGKGSPPWTVAGNGDGAATMENSVEVPETLEAELPSDPASPLLDMYLEKKEPGI